MLYFIFLLVNMSESRSVIVTTYINFNCKSTLFQLNNYNTFHRRYIIARPQTHYGLHYLVREKKISIPMMTFNMCYIVKWYKRKVFNIRTIIYRPPFLSVLTYIENSITIFAIVYFEHSSISSRMFFYLFYLLQTWTVLPWSSELLDKHNNIRVV